MKYYEKMNNREEYERKMAYELRLKNHNKIMTRKRNIAPSGKQE
jgi:hypothetical protein